jgi:hypothetical protein
MYGGYDEPAAPPDGARIAKILYWATDRKSIVTAQLGQATATINGEWWPVAASCLDHRTWKKKVAVVPLPGSNDKALLLALKNDDPTDPEFIGWGLRVYARTAEGARTIKAATEQITQDLRDTLRDARSGIRAVQWRDVTTPATTQPSAPQLAAPATPVNTETLEISGSTAELLKEVEDDPL